MRFYLHNNRRFPFTRGIIAGDQLSVNSSFDEGFDCVSVGILGNLVKADDAVGICGGILGRDHVKIPVSVSGKGNLKPGYRVGNKLNIQETL